MIDQDPILTQSDEPVNLLDRLISDSAARAAKEIVAADDFEFKVNMAKSSAYLRNPELVPLIKSLKVIPDGQLADAGKSEINLTSFVRGYLDPSEWSEYISESSEDDNS